MNNETIIIVLKLFIILFIPVIISDIGIRIIHLIWIKDTNLVKPMPNFIYTLISLCNITVAVVGISKFVPYKYTKGNMLFICLIAPICVTECYLYSISNELNTIEYLMNKLYDKRIKTVELLIFSSLQIIKIIGMCSATTFNNIFTIYTYI